MQQKFSTINTFKTGILAIDYDEIVDEISKLNFLVKLLHEIRKHWLDFINLNFWRENWNFEYFVYTL